MLKMEIAVYDDRSKLPRICAGVVGSYKIVRMTNKKKIISLDFKTEIIKERCKTIYMT